MNKKTVSVVLAILLTISVLTIPSSVFAAELPFVSAVQLPFEQYFAPQAGINQNFLIPNNEAAPAEETKPSELLLNITAASYAEVNQGHNGYLPYTVKIDITNNSAEDYSNLLLKIILPEQINVLDGKGESTADNQYSLIIEQLKQNEQFTADLLLNIEPQFGEGYTETSIEVILFIEDLPLELASQKLLIALPNITAPAPTTTAPQTEPTTLKPPIDNEEATTIPCTTPEDATPATTEPDNSVSPLPPTSSAPMPSPTAPSASGTAGEGTHSSLPTQDLSGRRMIVPVEPKVPVNNSSASSADSQSENSKNTASTGDSSPIVPLLLLCIAALAMIIISYKFRNEQRDI